jgi:PAS domain S-box-containing protein
MKNKNYELYFDNLLNNMLEGVAIHQLVFDENNIPIDYIILKVNSNYKKITGLNNVEGKLASEIYSGVTLLDEFSSVVIDKKAKKIEIFHQPLNIYFSISAAPWNDIGFITIFSDITQHVNDRKILNKNQKLYRNIFEKSKAIKLLVNPINMNIVDANNSAIDFYEHSIEELQKMKINEINILTFEEVLEKIKTVTKDEDEVIFNCKHKIKSGKIKDVDIYASIIESEDDDLLSLTIYDTTEIKKSQLELKNSQKRLLRAEIVSKTGNWEYHVDSNMILASEGAKKIYNINKNYLSYEEIKKCPLPEYRKILDETMYNLIENGYAYDVEFKIKINSEIKDIRSIANYDKKNKIVFGIIQDITTQKKNEEELEKSNSIKSVFLSNISHELRTPMNSIIGFSDILLERLNDNKETDIYKFLRSINSNSKHLDELLNNILDYSRLENDEFDIMYENFYINGLFDELFDIFENVNYSKNLNRVKLEFIKGEDRKIISDYIRLKQVLFNVISNSIKFTESGYIKISYTIVGEFIIFEVEDTGIGISPEQIQFVFDRFWQGDSTSRKKYKGTGLGLSISKRIVNLLSGEIYVESILNKKTIFKIKIPLEEINNDKNVVKNFKPDFSDKKVLILDEIPINYTLLSIYLNSLNINIESSTNEKDFIKKYNKMKNEIDLIFIDLNLKKVNIAELLKEIKKINSKCKIISKSGIENENINLIDYHLRKPINKNLLLSILNEVWQK